MSEIVFEIRSNIQIPSLNKYRKAKDHIERHNDDVKMRDLFIDMIQKQCESIFQRKKQIMKFAMGVRINSDKDIDNCILIVKYFTDALKNLSIIPDDNPRHFKSFSILHDESLTKDHFIVTLIELK